MISRQEPRQCLDGIDAVTRLRAAGAEAMTLDYLDKQSWRLLADSVKRLEAAWRQSPCPNLSDFVPAAGSPLRTQILIELVKVDQEHRLSSGECRLLEAYLADWPELTADQALVLQLLEAECLNRFIANAPPDLAELTRRFPDLASRIDLQAIENRSQAERSESRTFRSDDARTKAADKPTPANDDPISDGETRLLPGTRFGRYEIREQLGQGSMGAVYRAWDTRLRREVALKIPHQDVIADPSLTDQFLREAVAMAQVHHPAVCPVFDAFHIGGTLALTMAFLEGEHLGGWMTRNRLDQQQAAELLLQMTRGVDAIHERGVIHRDIKPTNVIIDRRGAPILTDFGLAMSSDDSRKSGTPSSLSGTPAYMSPEQIEGRETIDHRSDIYSLGVLLFQLLTGSLPFTGDLLTVLNAVRTQPPPKPSTLCPKLDRTLELICLKALAKRPDDRFESAEAMALALESCVKSLREKQRRRQRWMLAIVAVVFVVGSAVAAGYFLRPEPASDEDLMTLAKPRHTFRIPGAMSAHRSIVPVGASKLLVSSTDSGHSPFAFFDTQTKRIGPGFDFTVPDRFYGKGAATRRHEHHGAVLSSDGRYLFCTDDYANCLVRMDLRASEADSPAAFLELTHRWAQELAITPDGQRLVTATGRDGTSQEDDYLVIVDIADGSFQRLAEVPLPGEMVSQGFGFRPDSQSTFVATGLPNPMICEIALTEPYQVTRTLRLSGSKPRDLIVDPRHNQILVSDAISNTIRVIDLEKLSDTGRRFPLYRHAPGPLALSRDGNQLFVLCPEARKLICLDPITGEIVGGAHDLPADAEQMHVAPDGSRLWTAHPKGTVAQIETDDLLHRIVFTSDQDGPPQIHALTLDGQSLPLTNGPEAAHCPRWSPDGRRIACISKRDGYHRICLINRAGDGLRVLKRTDPVIGEQHEVPLDWSPDGQQIAFVGGHHQAIRVVEVASGKIRTLLDGDAVPTPNHRYDHHNGLAWSRSDGTILFNSQVRSDGYHQDVLGLDPASGKLTAVTDLWGINSHVIAPAAAPDGSRVAVVQLHPDQPSTSHVCLVQWPSAVPPQPSEIRPLTEPTPADENTRNPRWFPDSRRLLYTSAPAPASAGQSQIVLIPATGGPPLALTPPDANSRDPDIWSPR